MLKHCLGKVSEFLTFELLGKIGAKLPIQNSTKFILYRRLLECVSFPGCQNLPDPTDVDSQNETFKSSKMNKIPNMTSLSNKSAQIIIFHQPTFP